MQPRWKAIFPIVFVSLLVTTIVVTTIDAQDKKDQPDKKQIEKAKPFMHAKLIGSQSVLDGLVREDFRRIYQGADRMKKLSEAAQWPQSDDKVYDHFSKEFRRQCDKLMELADDKNLEGAHYTYLGMTTSCINCHNYVRRSFRVERDKENPHGPVRLIPTEWEGNTFRRHRQIERDE